MTSVRSGELTLGGLVADARNGDKHAWNQIVDRCAPLIWSICRQYGLSRPEAEDVGQSVWLRLVERLGTLRDPEALPGWLATTTRHECSHVLGAAFRRVISGYSPDPDTMPDEQAGWAERDVLLAERNAMLWEAFATLSPRCQRLLMMLIADPPVPYTEISAELGIAVGSIGRYRSRCLQALRNYPPLVALIRGDAGSRQGSES